MGQLGKLPAQSHKALVSSRASLKCCSADVSFFFQLMGASISALGSCAWDQLIGRRQCLGQLGVFKTVPKIMSFLEKA